METINNVAQAAVKAVWGESNDEPVSGKTGDTSKGEPYDAGNMGKPRSSTGVTGSDAVKPTDFSSGANYGTSSDKQTSSGLGAGDSDLTGTSRYTATTDSTKIAPLEDNYDPAGGSVNTSSTHQSTSNTGGASGLGAGDSDVTGTSRYTGTTDSTNLAPLEDNYNPAGGNVNTSGTSTSHSGGATGGISLPPAIDSGGNKTSTHHDTTSHHDTSSHQDTYSHHDTSASEQRDVNTSGRDTASSGPHKEFGSSVKPGTDMSKAQQDVRDPDDPMTDPKEAHARSNVDDTGDGLDKGDNPEKVDGPGPRPIDQVAKDFGGDAGRAKPDTAGKGKGAGADDEDDDGPQKTSHGEGTGEQYVKSSGLKADGGDFDATKPGAGKEADRLLESKGIHHEVGKPAATADDDATDAAGGHEKKSLKEKIKEKLHKH